MSPTVVHVNLPPVTYDVSVQPGILDDLGRMIAGEFKTKSAAIVTDSHVASSYAIQVEQSLTKAGIAVTLATIPAGEAHKTLAHILPIYDRLLGARIERGTPLLSIGGGVVTDMGGFVAATVLRGVPLVQVPTTLLAMVDASIGGKTGVDHAMGKNLIGAFYQPRAVVIDPLTLSTLPLREFRSGMAECIKHDLIRDAAGFARLESQMDVLNKFEMTALTELIAHNVAIKARVVEADPFEKGERAHLNFGHTFGHAIESTSNFSYAHGEAVSLGMTAAAYTSRHLGLIDEAARGRIVAILGRVGLPTRGMNLPVDKVLEAMQSDKKVKAGKIRFVLLERIGSAVVRDDVPMQLVSEALKSLADEPA